MTRLSVCSLGVSCNEMIDTPMLLVVLPQHVRNVFSCSTIIFKKKLDQFLCNLDDKPCTPHFDNSVVHVTKCDTNFVSC